MKHCRICDPSKEWLIKDYDFWSVCLHPNKSYLGRCFFPLKRHIEDLTELTQDEERELFSIIREMKEACDALFHPDLINYAFLGNEERHIHLNFVPRYSGEAVFDKIIFTDERWNKNYSPYDKDAVMADDIIKSIVTAYRSKLSGKSCR